MNTPTSEKKRKQNRLKWPLFQSVIPATLNDLAENIPPIIFTERIFIKKIKPPDMNQSSTIVPMLKSDWVLRPLPADKNLPWKKLAISNTYEVRFIPFEEIFYCNSLNNYTTVHTKDGKSYLCCKTLKDIESKLPADLFVRIHHSYLVNLHCITALKKQTGELEIAGK